MHCWQSTHMLVRADQWSSADWYWYLAERLITIQRRCRRCGQYKDHIDKKLCTTKRKKYISRSPEAMHSANRDISTARSTRKLTCNALASCCYDCNNCLSNFMMIFHPNFSTFDVNSSVFYTFASFFFIFTRTNVNSTFIENKWAIFVISVT